MTNHIKEVIFILVLDFDKTFVLPNITYHLYTSDYSKHYGHTPSCSGASTFARKKLLLS